MESHWRMDKKARGLKLIASKLELEEFCSRHGYSVDMLARELNVSRATIFNWKKDARDLPRLVSLALYALQTEPLLRNVDTSFASNLVKQYRRGTYTSVKSEK